MALHVCMSDGYPKKTGKNKLMSCTVFNLVFWILMQLILCLNVSACACVSC